MRIYDSVSVSALWRFGLMVSLGLMMLSCGSDDEEVQFGLSAEEDVTVSVDLQDVEPNSESVASTTTQTIEPTEDEPDPSGPAPDDETAVETPSSSSLTSSSAPSHAGSEFTSLQDLNSPSGCVDRNEQFIVSEDTAVWIGNDTQPYNPKHFELDVPSGSIVVVRQEPGVSGDLDGDGVDDGLEFVTIYSAERAGVLAEGFRICGTSTLLVPWFQPASGGNFGVSVVELASGSDAISIGSIPEIPDEMNTWFFNDEGVLSPPFDR